MGIKHQKKKVAASKEKKNKEKEVDVYCICRQPERHPMIGCDFCEKWYHGSCLNLKKDDINELKPRSWKCPKCVIPDRKKERPKVKNKKMPKSKCPNCAFTTNKLFLLRDHVEKNHFLSSSAEKTDLKWNGILLHSGLNPA